MWMASSKSLASSGSMVKVFFLRRSRRRAISSSGISSGMASASRSTSFGKRYSIPWFRAMARLATRGSLAAPRTSRMRPSGAAFGSVKESMETSTLSPCFAPLNASSGT
jgi:hypothetical protein